jgi:hypothetical protein
MTMDDIAAQGGKKPSRRKRVRRDDANFASHELEHGRRQRSDPHAWFASVEQSQRMGQSDLSSLDPGPIVAQLLADRRERVLFAGQSARETTATLTEAPSSVDGAPVVATIAVDSNVDFTVGTLVLRPPDRFDGLFEATRVFDLRDGVTKDLRLIRFSAANVKSHYVWGRICGRGLYAAITLPFDLASLVALSTLSSLALPMARSSERDRLSTARAITRAVTRATAPNRRGRTALSPHGLATHLRRRGVPAPSVEAPSVSYGDPTEEVLDRLAGRFAQSPLLPEIQILLDIDRQRSAPWFG